MLLDEPLAALMSSSLRHSAMLLMLRKAASRAPVQRSQIAWLTLLRGDTSTACLLTVPARPIRVESSRGPELMIALTTTCRGFSPVRRWMISKEFDNSDCHELLAVVPSVHHQGVN